MTNSRLPPLRFYYHMYGRSVQTLSVQSCLAGQNGSACTTLWSRSGQQQGSSGAGWRQATITLPANTNTVQWTGTSVPGQIQGDISVDTIVVAQGPVPPTPAPTSPPPCAAPTAADFFTVTFTNQGTSCAGVGGICYTTSSGSCFTDGPGNYGNNERCSILVRRAGVLAVQGTLGIATGDYFLVSGSNTRRNTARQINGLVVVRALLPDAAGPLRGPNLSLHFTYIFVRHCRMWATASPGFRAQPLRRLATSFAYVPWPLHTRSHS